MWNGNFDFVSETDWDHYARTYRQIERDPNVPALLAGFLAGRSGRAIDVGCGEGDLLDRLVAHYPSWDVTGFEVSEYRATLARQRGHRVVVEPNGRIEGDFDLTISQHVIEHVPDDHEHAIRLASATVTGGFVYVETPLRLRGAWYFRRSPTAGWVLDPTHLREYRSVGELVDVIESAGLSVEGVAVTPLVVPLRAGVALMRRVLHLRAVDVEAFPGSVSIPRYRIAGVLAQKKGSVGKVT
jgi:2-polyprenyl-3-methyl-5-hydroxy-6-metoxy-1,4-benzoquinol methylase